VRPVKNEVFIFCKIVFIGMWYNNRGIAVGSEFVVNGKLFSLPLPIP